MDHHRHRHQILHLSRRAVPPPTGQVTSWEPLAGEATAGPATLLIVKRNPAEGDSQPKGDLGSSASSRSSTTLPIVLGIFIPISVAIAVLVFLHRRHTKKLRREDANDKRNPSDFGLDDSVPGVSGGKEHGRLAPEMATRGTLGPGNGAAQGRGGLSIDMGSPYLLPPGLHDSRDSLHSLSRTMHNVDDRYRPAITFVPNENSSVRSYPANSHRSPDDSSSLSTWTGVPRSEMKQELLQNAAAPAVSTPPKIATPTLDPGKSSTPAVRQPEPVYGSAWKRSIVDAPESGLAPLSARTAGARDSYVDRDIRKSNTYLRAFISFGEDKKKQDDTKVESAARELPRLTIPPPLDSSPFEVHPSNSDSPVVREPERRQSMVAPVIQLPNDMDFYDDASDYGDDVKDVPLPPRDSSKQITVSGTIQHCDTANEGSNNENNRGLTIPGSSPGVRRMSMGFRPLPPEDASDDPEQRANRIRSFYKEYFDESKSGAVRRGRPTYEGGEEGAEGLAYVDPHTGEFIVAEAPYAEPVTRRAMTPPPRAPPRFGGGARKHPSMSGFAHPSSRAHSSASGAFGPGRPGGPPGPRRPLPPPSPLRVLPSPHLVKEDSFALPIDFAPPATYQDRRAGRPESPMGGFRPYSPAVPAHLPLTSSFDDLSVMPSPHALRKSATYTALDFAPPPRFKNSDSGSDAGSIRSGHSGRSARSVAQLQNIRAGAYRVSRLPKEVVGTKADLAANLRPTWDMREHIS